MIIAYFLVAARVYVRVWLRNAKIYSADYLLFAGLAACQGLLICDTMTYRMNAMDDFTISNVALKKVCFHSYTQNQELIKSTDPIRDELFLRLWHLLSEIQHHRILFQPRSFYAPWNAHSSLRPGRSHGIIFAHHFFQRYVLVRAGPFGELVGYGRRSLPGIHVDEAHENQLGYEFHL